MRKLFGGLLFSLVLWTQMETLAAQSTAEAKFQPDPATRVKVAFTWSDSWFSRDKMHHFLSSAFLTTTGYYFFREENHWRNERAHQGGVVFSISLGLLKEIRDGASPGRAFSWKDLIADCAGTALGLALVSNFR
ncbi:MAG: VanZ family protein [candidate division KSB1 bacterium]|nr:VanZ family protein [candidate division KSB1 bacterium]MDZ7319206.1 VanZ family protein [candidate division KSB1 bacterium]